MNNDRRKAIAALKERVEGIITLRDELVSEAEAIRDEEQEYLDNMPESLQSSEKGDNAQSAIDALEEAISELQDLDVDNVLNSLDTAAE